MRSRHDRVLELTERRFRLGVDAGLLRNRIEDQTLEDPYITIEGTRLVNFGSAAYLGLNRDQRLKRGAIDAVERYGTTYSSSTAYTAVPLYDELEEKLRVVFDAEVVLAQTTTLAHLAALPVLVGPDDLVVIDSQTHASVHLAAAALKGGGTPVVSVPHNDIDALVGVLERSGQQHHRVWYLADGIYSMFGDLAPVEKIVALLDDHPTLHLYFDDAHGLGWQGLHGRGSVLEAIGWHERMVVAGGLSKSFGALGAVIAFGDPALAPRVTACGGPVTFSGPIQPADLGAAIASADIHLSSEHTERQERLLAQIDLVGRRLVELQLPIMSLARTPIWYIRIGHIDRGMELLFRLRRDGFYVNPASFPMVPIGFAGVRFAHTLHHSDEHLHGLLDALGRHVPDLVEDLDVTIDLRDGAMTLGLDMLSPEMFSTE